MPGAILVASCYFHVEVCSLESSCEIVDGMAQTMKFEDQTGGVIHLHDDFESKLHVLSGSKPPKGWSMGNGVD